jgi:hypothetical protein
LVKSTLLPAKAPNGRANASTMRKIVFLIIC